MNFIPVAIALFVGAEPAGSWHTINRVDGVLVELQDHGEGIPDIRATATLSAPIEQVIAVLEDLDHYQRFMPKVAKSEVLERTASGMVAYLEYDAPWPASHRDSLGRYRVERKGTSVSFVAEAIRDPRRPPRPGLIRLENIRSRWLLTPLPSGATQVEYQYFGDIGGNLPRFILEKAWRDEPVVTFQALRQEIGRRGHP